MKKFNSPKKYYEKYWYKLEFFNSIAHIFRDKNFAYARSMLESIQHEYDKGTELILRKAYIEIPVSMEDFLDAKYLLQKLSQTKTDYMIRIEMGSISLYANSPKFLFGISDKLYKECKYYSPSDNLKDLINEIPRVAILKRPTDFKYRVTLKNRVSTDFAAWIDANRDKIKIGTRAYEYIKTSGFCHGYYFYVKSPKVLSLLNIFIGNNIRKIEEVVVDPTIDK